VPFGQYANLRVDLEDRWAAKQLLQAVVAHR
jgi:hypothetical protein